jgi:hypothetical protein
MRANILYIFMLFVAVVVIVVFTRGIESRKRFNEKVTLRRNDKIPYGTNVAYRSLPLLFPGASIFTGKQEPGYWDSLSMQESGQAFICISDRFNPDEFEMKRLISFAKAGNDIFISAFYFSEVAEKQLYEEGDDSVEHFNAPGNTYDDSLTLSIERPITKTFSYPGANNSFSFTSLNLKKAMVLGKEEEAPDFIHLKAGRGNIFVHRAPMALTNYFLLHKNNIGYWESIMSFFSPHVKKILWDEYFISKRRNKQEGSKSWLSVLMQYPGLSTAIIVGVLTLLVYSLAEMRRKQRMIPIVTKPRNDSLDFVKTIGRLYHEKGDHRNLAKKMSSYFLEHVRNRYKLPTVNLDEQFIRTLQFKTNVEEGLVRDIVTSIKYFEDSFSASPRELQAFYRKLENFYQQA